MRLSAPFPVLFFASAAHGMHHVLLTLYFTLVLILARVWRLPYNDLIALWTLGAMLVGLGAPFAGWLADRIGETKVLILCFLGLGVSSILCGFAQNAGQLEGALALLGLSGSIYHPVGNSWVVKHAIVRGRAIALTGVAGSIGVALGPVVAASVAALWSWRVAFIAPGALTIALGSALLVFHLSGRIVDRGNDSVPQAHAPSREDITRTYAVMAFTMTATLVAYSAFGTALPKLIELSNIAGRYGLFGIGAVVSAIELLGAGAQFAGGHFADRGVAKRAYLAAFCFLAVVFVLVAFSGGWGVAAASVAAIFLFESIAPIETAFVARYTQPQWRGFAFGVRYGLATFGTPLGVWLIARLYSPVNHFLHLLALLSVLSLAALAGALFLPSDQPRPASASF